MLSTITNIASSVNILEDATTAYKSVPDYVYWNCYLQCNAFWYDFPIKLTGTITYSAMLFGTTFLLRLLELLLTVQ